MQTVPITQRPFEHVRLLVVLLEPKLDSTVGHEVPVPSWEAMAGGDFDLPGFRGFALSALGLSGLVLGIWWFWSEPRSEPSRAQLVVALGPNRLSEGRFSGGFQYAPFQGSGRNQLRGKSLARTYREFESAAKRRPSPDVRAGFAVLNLAAGKTEEALRLFDQEASRGPERVGALSDLAAAWLARASLSQDPFDLIRALDAADRAVRLNPDLPEAWFNLAVAQERLFLPGAAARSWAIYLSLDESSPWAWEARARLLKARDFTDRELWERERLRLDQAVLAEDGATIETIVRRFPLPVRLWAEEELLPRWAEAELAGSGPLAALLLRGAGRVAACHELITGDAALSESVQAIENARDAARRELAHGHLLFGKGRKAYADERLEEAERLFRQAQKDFGQDRSPFALWADLSIAICRFEDKDFPGALSQLNTLLRRIGPYRYQALAARAHWIRGMVQFGRGEPTLSLRDFQQALVSLSGTRAAEDEGAIHYLIAANLSYLGDSQEAWRHLYQALAATPGTIQERRLFSAFDEAGTALEKAGEVRAALYFRDAVIALSRVSGRPDPTGLGHAYLRRAESRWKAGDEADARTDLRQARTLAGRIDNTSLREAALARVDVAEAEVRVATAPEQALDLFGAALAYYLRLGSYFDLPRIYLGRYRALRGMGRLHEAALDLERGISEYEQMRERVVDEGNRISYFDQARQLFEGMIRFQEEMGRHEVALWYAERERSRDLLDLRAATRKGERSIGARPLEPQVLAARMPDGVALVEYAVLNDRLLAWVVRRGSIIPFSLSVSRSDLASRIRETRDDLANGDRRGRLPSNLEDLYDRIVRPLETALGSENSIVFVPDGPLSRLPFAALRDRSQDRYLIESRAVSVTPSASFYIDGAGVAGRALSANPSVLAVGASNFDRTAFNRLASLSHAEMEARAVASVYSRSTFLLGTKSTRDRFIAELGEHEVIHFAGHTLGIPELPSSSMMLFAPFDEDDSGLLRVADLYRVEMKKARVVVLSSCESGISSSEGSEIGFGFVRPFLAYGVGTVAASLWNVSDVRSRDLLVRFHRYMAGGMSPARALQRAQIELINAQDSTLASPSFWASLQIFEVSGV